ncbi:MAG: polymerase, sigma-24 subunit, subfamily [Conexibacter sp.]|nr:polymerase, sigma-24 subunit, subfamily [Conexibacter sp.]
MPHPPPRSATDAALVLAARDDAGAFHELYRRHVDRIHSQHLRQTRDADAAHDLTAETFAQAWLVRERFRDEAGGSALPWLLGIARNVLLTSVRRRVLEQRACERLGLRERLDGPPASAEPTDAWLTDLDDLFAELPHSQREALRLRVLEDRDYAGVATVLGTTEQAARVRVHRALRTLRTRLTDPKELHP